MLGLLPDCGGRPRGSARESPFLTAGPRGLEVEPLISMRCPLAEPGVSDWGD